MITIARYGELGTKSKYVRKQMENQLIANIRDYLKKNDIKASVKNLCFIFLKHL